MTPTATSIADCVLPPVTCSSAVQYATWSGSGNSGAFATPSNIFGGTWTSGRPSAGVNQASSGGSSNTLNETTPWGQTYGTTVGNTYFSFYAVTTSPVANPTTLTFTTPCSPTNQCGFALGDVDSESIQITAIGTDGVPLTAAELGYQSSFNADGYPDTPVWDATTSTLAGQGPDTFGETGWFKPTRPVQSLTMSSTLLQGAPQYQVFMAGFTC